VKKPASTLFSLILAGVVGFVLYTYKIEGLDQIQFLLRNAITEQKQPALTNVPPRQADKIRIASFNIQVFGNSKMNKPAVMDVLARICRLYDVVAIQEIRAKNQDILPLFVEQINSVGRHYDYVIGPRLGRTDSKEQYAFIFDRETLEVDRNELYTVNDPDDRLHREPLVAWFRTRSPAVEDAFTFTLVNIHTDPDETKTELNALDDVFHVVAGDGRNEDDVILLGDFNVDDRHLGQLGQIPGITWTLSGTPTNTLRNKQYDNLLFMQDATSEFTGRAGVFDFLREYDLSVEEAKEVSDHLPVWAEFSVYEGGQPGRVATRTVPATAK